MASSITSAPAFQHVDVPGPESPDVCQCCLSTNSLRSIVKPYLYHGKSEVYSDMLATCFSAELSSNDGSICSDCVRRLRATLSFRLCVQSSKDYLNTQKPIITGDYKLTCNEKRVVKCLDVLEIDDQKHKTIASTNSSEKIKAELHETSSLNGKSDNENFEDQLSFNEDEIKPPNSTPTKTAKSSNVLNSGSDSSDDDDDDFFNSVKIEPTKIVFRRMEFDVGEQKTLPYALDNTDRTCEICHKEFSFFGELLKHMPEHYPNHICDICGKICATRKSFMFHTKTHTDVRHECELCDKSFKNKSNLNTHVKVQHKGQKILFKCNICGENLNTYNNRIKHQAEKHGREEKAYKCMQCPCKYKLGSHLRAHIRRVHLQEKNHKCQQCGLSFFTRKCLENHTLKHSGERNMMCNICGKSYGTKQSLKLHLKTHEAEKQNYLINPEPGLPIQEQVNNPYMQEDQRYTMRNYMRM